VRYAGGLLLLVAGLASGVAAVVVHERGWWALAWVTASVLATMVWVGAGWVTRLPFAVGFDTAVGAGAYQRAEGDYLVGTSPHGYALLALAFLLLLWAVVTLPRPQRLRGGAST
jgi:hypothetical protein